MKKIIIFILSIALTFSIIGCSNSDKSSKEKNNTSEWHGSDPDQGVKGLRIISGNSWGDRYCFNGNGLYRLTFWDDEYNINTGVRVRNIMYMDFATRQEVYLCNNSGCNHDTEECTAVISTEDLIWQDSIFLFNNHLYILASENDEEGYFHGVEDGGSDYVNPYQQAEQPAVLYEMNLDGTDRKKIYEFDPQIRLDSTIAADENYIYFVTKKLNTGKSKKGSYTSAAEKYIFKFDPVSKRGENVIDLTFGEEETDWKFEGAYEDKFVLTRISYGEKMSFEEEVKMFTDEEYFDKLSYEKSMLDVKTVCIGDKKTEIKYSVPYQREDNYYDYKMRDNYLYINYYCKGKIVEVDLDTGKEKILVDLGKGTGEGGGLCVFNDIICCSPDGKMNYYINRKDGKYVKSYLEHKAKGYSIDFYLETGDYFFVCYDWETNKDGSIKQYKYGLLKKEDAYEGKANYLPIENIHGQGIW